MCNAPFEAKNSYSKFCGKECYRLHNIEYNRAYRLQHKKEPKQNLTQKVRECVVCGNAYFPSSNCQKTCSQGCRTININRIHKKFRDTKKSPVTEKHCSKCGQLFVPKNNSCTICGPCHEHKPRQVKCLNCGKEFTSTGKGVQLLCSDECRRERKNKLRVQYGFHREPATKVTCTCQLCGKEFQQRKGTKYCNDCRPAAKAIKMKELRSEVGYQPRKKEPVIATCAQCGHQFQKNRGQKFCSDACRTISKNASREKYKLNHPAKPKNDQQPLFRPLRKRDRKAEKELLDILPTLNANAPKHDREVLTRKSIESPDHNQMPFIYTDKKLRITYYFSTEEKYNKHLKKLAQ